MTLGNSMLIPILQPMQNSLGISEFQASLTITVFSIAAAIFIPILGYLSDRFSRKVIILPSLILYGIGGLIAGIVSPLFRCCSWPTNFFTVNGVVKNRDVFIISDIYVNRWITRITFNSSKK